MQDRQIAPQAYPTSVSLFRPGHNCWRVANAGKASLLVDYGNYYRALYNAIVAARHSVFIIGWDIDSRIALVRGTDAKGLEAPVQLLDLIRWKAERDPEVQIYLNKWDFSVFFARQREFYARRKWKRMPANVHYCVDSMIPPAACHHQKIVVVDDDVAFSGGMDIALNRWDFREHHPENPDRWDPGGMTRPHTHVHYGPYHDIMIVVTGDAAAALGEWARIRWKTATGRDAVPLQPQRNGLWPHGHPPDFNHVDIAISRTLPGMHREHGIYEVEAMLLDEIRKAERFIYIENQFLTYLPFARTLNEQLRRKPDLRVLAVSCDKPQGIMERKSMWSGRVLFRDTVESGGVADRVVIAHPISRERGIEQPVRIHSKLMIVDDQFLHVGSANINTRSMRFDTECDIVIEARDDRARSRIAALRTDLAREHTGFEAAEIEKLIATGAKAEKFLNYLSTSRQHLKRIDDEAYRHERFAALARKFADPEKAFIPGWMTMPRRGRSVNKPRAIMLAGLFLSVAGMALAWKFTPLSSYASPDRVAPLLEEWRGTPWFVPGMILLYIVAEMLFFPITVLDASTVIALGLPWGPVIALAGASSSAAAAFMIGRLAGRRTLREMLGEPGKAVMGKVRHIGIPGIALLRMLPVAPFSVVNFAVGMSPVKFTTFIAGTALGLLPGLAALSFLRGLLIRVWRHPDLQGCLALGAAIIFWFGLLFALSVISRRWHAARAGDGP